MSRLVGAACIALVLSACSRTAEGPPATEFLLGAADSTFWIATTSGETHVRGAPLILARYDARFYEVYAHHEDLSYPDAILLGDRIYRRDILTGDSTLVFADTMVPRMAKTYAATHPDERPLRPDEDGEADPATSITAEFDILDMFGPYLSYEYHLDVEMPGKRAWHSTRQGVVDLRTGRAQRPEDLFGLANGARLVADARRSFAAIRDSLMRARSSMSTEDSQAAAALERAQFDASSFTLSATDDRLEIVFGVPGQGEGPAGNVVELEPVAIDSVAWSKDVSPGLPRRDDEGSHRWQRRDAQIIARYDTSGTIAHVSVGNAKKREWALVTVQAPLFQILWLDEPALKATERQALTRAFNHAASYDEGARVASITRVSSPSYLQLVSSHATCKESSRESARNVGAHDARTREQHGPCVRRRDSLDDGQVRGDRGVSPQPVERRDRVDRPRGFSRTHSLGRPGGHESECQLRRAHVDGSGRSRRGGGPSDRPPAPHKLVLSDVRCR
jgi:hypothetical protein